MNAIVAINWDAIPSKRALLRQIDGLSIAAEGKLALTRMTELTTKVGDRIVEVGRRIIAFAFELLRQFPNLSFAILAALTINAILVSVPLLGPLLQPLYGPIVLAGGLGIGALAELREGDMRERLDTLTHEFQQIFG